MKKFLLIYAMGATLLLIVCVLLLHHTHNQTKRLRNANESLTSETIHYKTLMDESAASVLALELKLQEYKEMYARDVERIKSLKIRPRRVESVAKASTESEVAVTTPLIIPTHKQGDLADSLPKFRWNDRWTNIEGMIRDGELVCSIKSVDTIYQVIHRVPHRFLFIRYGTKAIRQEIISTNPHTQIVYAEYVELPKRRKRRR